MSGANSGSSYQAYLQRPPRPLQLGSLGSLSLKWRWTASKGDEADPNGPPGREGLGRRWRRRIKRRSRRGPERRSALLLTQSMNGLRCGRRLRGTFQRSASKEARGRSLSLRSSSWTQIKFPPDLKWHVVGSGRPTSSTG